MPRPVFSPDLTTLCKPMLALLMAASMGSAQAIDLNKLLSGENLNTAINILSNAGDAAKASSGNLGPEQEDALGRSVMANLLGAAPLVRDSALQRYVNQVGRWVALQSDMPNLNWRFGVIDSPNINSFAAAGGYILITRGLWDRLENEAELANVLAHEIIHVTRKHQIKAIASSKTQLASSQLISLIADYNSNKSYSKVGEKLGKAGSEIFVRGLDKNDEFEADQLGMQLAAKAGYNPYAMVSVLQLLGRVNPADSTVALMFSTHPSPQDRLNSIDSAIGDKLEPWAEGVENTARFNQVKR
ncbi:MULTISPECIES: M48 family metalloprotease [Chitinibacter]|uniref:M48 family metalloprotease n=1 Tax=Chitinibacter TaxID=230666 RepID=UPI0018CFD14B|nr:MULTISPECIES: M48 family metalloprotease [Chitinibacter]